MRSYLTPAVTVLALTLVAGCRADTEVFDQGATMETPAVVQDAPILPIPPQPMPSGPMSDTTLPPLDPDTITIENLRPPN